jgi:Fe-Mn family superoxide dismutase
MEIHHGKHHAGYTRKFNAALEGLSGYKSPEGVVRDLNSTPAEVRTSLRNNGGGYWNHSLFWEVLAPEGSGGDPSGDLHEAIKSAFGSLDAMKEAFNKAAASRFGSGWAWLIYDRTANLAVTSTPNQDNPLMEGIVPDGDLGQPILGLDVWEHAYYLNYQNRRGDYVKSFWNIVNWNKVNELFAEC